MITYKYKLYRNDKTKHLDKMLAANNILRRGIYELESDSKTSKRTAKRLSRLHPRIPQL